MRLRLASFLFLLPLVSVSWADERPAVWQIDAQSLQALRERPLFSVQRRPAIQVVAGRSAQVGQGASFALVGVIRDASGPGLAVIQMSTGEIVRLAPDETIEGWTLRVLASRRATFTSPAGSLDLALPDPARAPSMRMDAPTSTAPAGADDGPAMFPAPLVRMP